MMNVASKGAEALLSEVMGLDPDSLGAKSIAHAVNALMAAAGIESVDEYLAFLRSEKERLQDLIEKVVVPETWFFRDQGSFNYLRIHVREMGLPANEKRTIRLLSAPCSTGEEPYSMAMALLEMGLPPERFQIDAVDISASALDTAKKAVYGKASFRGAGRGLKERFFTAVEGGFKLDPHVAELVHFHRENLALPHALQEHECYDVVFCKNLLIYLTADARRTVIGNLDRLLLRRGLLFVGNSEVVTFLNHGYRPVRHARSFACEKACEPRPSQPAFTTVRARKNTPVHAEAKRAPITNKERVPEMEKLPPPAVSLEEIRALADRGALHDALKQCERFLRDHRLHKEGYCLMGLIHFALNSFAAAEEFFQKVLYLDPHHQEALVQMGLLYEKKGDRAKAAIMRDRIERFRLEKTSGQERL